MNLVSIRTAAIALALSAVTAVSAATLTLPQVNQQIAELLGPFNNKTTEANLVFNALDIDETNVRAFSLSGLLKKVGSVNELILSVPKIEYLNPKNEGDPRASGKISLKFDLVKAFGQDYLDEMAPEADEWVKSFLADVTKEYGDAITVDAGIDELVRDDQGHVVLLKLHLGGRLDLDKLPADKKPDQEMVIGGRFEFTVGRTEAKLSGHANFNPKYKGFSSDERGLKETIEGLLNMDQRTYEEMSMMVAWVDRLADELVNSTQKQ